MDPYLNMPLLGKNIPFLLILKNQLLAIFCPSQVFKVGRFFLGEIFNTSGKSLKVEVNLLR